VVINTARAMPEISAEAWVREVESETARGPGLGRR
jgi:hypothetical protein